MGKEIYEEGFFKGFVDRLDESDPDGWDHGWFVDWHRTPRWGSDNDMGWNYQQ